MVASTWNDPKGKNWKILIAAILSRPFERSKNDQIRLTKKYVYFNTFEGSSAVEGAKLYEVRGRSK